jgi:GDP-4-dehydro-6-deoxy-D-mannose reductase
VTEPQQQSARYHRILMTGGTGFVGGTFCPDLVEAFPQSERLLLTRPGDAVRRTGFEAVAADLGYAEAVDRIVADFQPDLVLHLAAQASVGVALRAAESTWRINCGATVNLAAAVAKHAPQSVFFFVSTGEVYGLHFKNGPADEASHPQPVNSYARSKLAAEMALGDILPPETTLVVVRPFNHTGPGQDTRFVLPAFADQIARIEAGSSEPVVYVGNLDAERDFLDVRDVSHAYIALLQHAPAFPSRTLFNIASGDAYRVMDLLERLKALSGFRFDIAVDESRLRASEVRRVVGRSDRLAEATGWRPKFAIDDTLRSILDYHRTVARTRAPSP